MPSRSDCPSSFFVDVVYPGFAYPMREMVRFSPAFGLVFNRGFSKRYAIFARRGLYVDRDSFPFLRFFDSVRFDLDGVSVSLPVR